MSGEESTTSTTSRDVAEVDPKLKIDKSGLYDLQQVKRLLDDEAISFIESEGYEESTSASYAKIIFGTISVVAAVYSHFNPYTFPENRTLIIVCVAIYGVCASIMNGVQFVFEGSSFYNGVLTPKKRLVKKDAAPRVWLTSYISDKHGSSNYRISLSDGARRRSLAEMSNGYENYLTENGTFLVNRFHTDMKKVLANFHSASGKKKN